MRINLAPPLVTAQIPPPASGTIQEMSVVVVVGALVIALVAVARYPRVVPVAGNTPHAPAAQRTSDAASERIARPAPFPVDVDAVSPDYISKAVDDVSRSIFDKPNAPPVVVAKRSREDAVLASAPAATAIDRDRSDRNRSSSRSESPAPERAAGASAVASTATS
ncbi:MAG TPA: hypothetical protein VF456_28410, partial [Vicinamibacterales bacterium]